MSSLQFREIAISCFRQTNNARILIEYAIKLKVFMVKKFKGEVKNLYLNMYYENLEIFD